MSTLLKPLLVRQELLSRGVGIFTAGEFGRVFKVSRYQAKYFLEQQSKQGLFVRLKKGLYALRTDMPGEEEVANSLYRPSYVSFEYALAKYNILPEMPYVVSSATTKPTREFEVEGKVFSFLTIKKEAYTGYRLEDAGKGKRVLIAEPEKALADYLYFVSLGKKPFNDRLELSLLNRGKLVRYARLFARQGVNELVERIYDQ